MLTTAREIPAFGRIAGKWWLPELIGQWQSRQHFGTRQIISSAGCVLWAWAAAERVLRQRSIDFLASPCNRCWRPLAAQL